MPAETSPEAQAPTPDDHRSFGGEWQRAFAPENIRFQTNGNQHSCLRESNLIKELGPSSLEHTLGPTRARRLKAQHGAQRARHSCAWHSQHHRCVGVWNPRAQLPENGALLLGWRMLCMRLRPSRQNKHKHPDCGCVETSGWSSAADSRVVQGELRRLHGVRSSAIRRAAKPKR